MTQHSLSRRNDAQHLDDGDDAGPDGDGPASGAQHDAQHDATRRSGLELETIVKAFIFFFIFLLKIKTFHTLLSIYLLIFYKMYL